jgi:hypothetical protein
MANPLWGAPRIHGCSLDSILDLADDLALPDDVTSVDIKSRNHPDRRARELDDQRSHDPSIVSAYSYASPEGPTRLTRRAAGGARLARS